MFCLWDGISAAAKAMGLNMFCLWDGISAVAVVCSIFKPTL